MHDDVDSGRQLAVYGFPRQAGGDTECLDPRGEVMSGVRVHRAAPALVSGVERREQIDDLGTTYLTDDETIGSHPQRLSYQVTEHDGARTLEVDRTPFEAHDVRVVGPELTGVLDDHQALGGIDEAEHGGEQGGLAASRTARQQERDRKSGV